MHTFTLLSICIFSLVETITLENLEKKHCPVWHAKCSLTVSFRGLETLVVFGLRQIQLQGIFWSEIQQISQFKGTQKKEKKGCNLGNPANAFVMATSKQILVDQAQRLDTGLVEKLVENLFGFFWDGGFEKDRIKVIATGKIIIIERNRKSTHMKRISRAWLAIACQFVPNSAGS